MADILYGSPHVAYPISLRDAANPWAIAAGAATTIDATNEYIDYIGQVWWEDQPAAAKTVSSAGGAIVARYSGVTFANAGTTMRVGIQDVDLTLGPPARGDGTFDVSADLVGGTDTITATLETPMETGTKSIAHGALVAIRFLLVSRAGADTISLVPIGCNNTINPNIPHVTQNTGTPTFVQSQLPNVLLKADDGTYGWLVGAGWGESVVESTFDSASNPDEYGSLVNFPEEKIIWGVGWVGRIIGDGGSYKAILYTDPLGSPSAAREVTIDTDAHSGFGGRAEILNLFSSSIKIAAGTDIFVALQPQDANGDVAVQEIVLGSNAGAGKPWRCEGGVWRKGTRLNASGAVSETTTSRMLVGPVIGGVVPGAGASGGPAVLRSYPYPPSPRHAQFR